MKKIKNLLPDKPSELLKVALSDLKKVERSKNFVVDMSSYVYWPSPERVGQCHVCFAGAVMMKSLKKLTKERLKTYAPDVQVFVPSSYGELENNTAVKLRFLDGVRTSCSTFSGYIKTVFNISSKTLNDATALNGYIKLPNIPNPVIYQDSPTAFKKRISRIIEEYVKLGM